MLFNVAFLYEEVLIRRGMTYPDTFFYTMVFMSNYYQIKSYFVYSIVHNVGSEMIYLYVLLEGLSFFQPVF
jgi:hypothetical protein